MKRLDTGPVKAIFFDYGGTLDAPGVAWKEQFFPIYKKHGVNVREKEFARAFYASDDSLTSENPVHMNLTEVVYEQVSRVLKNLDIFSPALQEKIARDFLKNCFTQISKNISLLKRLKARFRLGIISNNYGNLEAICKETGLLNVVDCLVDSNLVGKTKPHPEIFQRGLDALKVLPHESIMVGDNVRRDIQGALDLGMQAVLISPDGVSHGVSLPEIPVISQLDELIEILGIRQ